MLSYELSATMKMQLLIMSLIPVCFFACSSIREAEPSGPIARFGSTPIIDGVFEEGEWGRCRSFSSRYKPTIPGKTRQHQYVFCV